MERYFSFHRTTFWRIGLIIIIIAFTVTHVRSKAPFINRHFSPNGRVQALQVKQLKSSKYYPGIYSSQTGVPQYKRIKFAESRQHAKKEKHAHGQETKHSNKKDVDSTLDDLLEVMGPHLFLIPFVLKALPFAIPAIPISYILTRHAPATISELFMELMELSTQINELTMGQQEGNGGSPEG